LFNQAGLTVGLKKGIRLSPVAFLLFLLAPATAEDQGVSTFAGVQYAQLTVERRIVIRVPTLVTRRAAPPQSEIQWKEKKTKRCLPMKTVVGAAIKQPDSVDLILSDQRRVRARLDDDCRSADFYQGFYMEPTGDDLLCADRDMIHARNGAMCEIESFKRLVVEK
jgi:hypothetical protein